MVDETYTRIRQDSRHFGVVQIDRALIKARSFDHWSMGFKRLKASDVDAHPSYKPYFRDGFDAAAIGARNGAALEIVKKFASSQGR